MDDRGALVRFDPIHLADGAEAWLSEHGSPDVASMDDVQLSQFIKDLQRIAAIHPHLVETILDRLFDLPSTGSFSSSNREETYFICLGQYVINPVRIAPELILKGLESLDDAEQPRFQRVIKHAEQKLAREYPYLYSLHLRKQRARLIEGRPPIFGAGQIRVGMVKKIHELEFHAGVQLMDGNSLLELECRKREDLPPEMMEFAVLRELEGGASSAANALDVLFNTLNGKSDDERLDFLVHLRRVITDSSLTKIDDPDAHRFHRIALRNLERQMKALTDNWSPEHPLTKRLNRIKGMQDQQDRAGQLKSLVWGFNLKALEIVN